MSLSKYLERADAKKKQDNQQKWFRKLENKAKKGISLYKSSNIQKQTKIWDDIHNRIRTEELKAWYSTPQDESLFQGTSISSLTIPYSVPEPLQFKTINDFVNHIADAYIELHYKYEKAVQGAIMEDTEYWLKQGLYYGVVISSKLISQVFELYISHQDVIFDINSYKVDPHEITSYPKDIRIEYFEKCKKKLSCFSGITLDQKELESSLVLADISKPKIEKYQNKILLAPIRCNDIASILSDDIVNMIHERSNKRINPKSLAVVIYDTDTPYTYHEIMGFNIWNGSPVLPGLTVLGASGTIDAFRWLYAYRTSLISQKIQKGSLYSQVSKLFIPYMFFGVLVWRDAEILLDMENLSMLRYTGNLSPEIEFAYLIPDIVKECQESFSNVSWEMFNKAHLIDETL